MRSAFISLGGTYRKECMYEVGLYFTERILTERNACMRSAFISLRGTYRKECMYEVCLYFTERYLQEGMHV